MLEDQQAEVSHDQLFKDLLRAFFREFMELFYPEVAARLDFARAVARDKEFFTDVPQGEEHRLDLLTEIYTLDGQPELVLIHIEVEARERRSMGERMHEDFMLLRLRLRLPVFPVVIYLQGGRGGLGKSRYEERVFDRRVIAFDYERIGLPRLPAAEYLESENPLAHGLAALMDPGTRRPAELKVECLLRIARALVDAARKALLVNCVETYLKLNEAEQRRFEQLVEQPSYEEAREMRTVYEIEGERRGTIRGKQEAALHWLRCKFGDLPDGVASRVQSMEAEAELNHLLDAIFDAGSLDELGLTGESNTRG
jgi:hypothetical protein